MKCINEINLCNGLNELNAQGMSAARNALIAQLDTAYCADRFGKVYALDLCDEDFYYEVKDNHGRTYYTASEMLNHSFSYMQLSSTKLDCKGEIADKFNICNLFDVEEFLIFQKRNSEKLMLKVITDFFVDGDSIEAFSLSIKDVRQLNLIAQIAVIDFIVTAMQEGYSFNSDYNYTFTSHLKAKANNNFEL
ncbi:hypothetical protein [Acinetobacter brisouii]|uniref:hypothetical protein n=1 Tax=Acinetobacter brisouii TaxID=396323 RepID=UPI00124CC4D3|nr:hypothetical protein [Acinetobacter brisouii]